MLGAYENRWVVIVVGDADVQSSVNFVRGTTEILHLELQRVISKSTTERLGSFETSRPVIGLFQREITLNQST